MRAFFPAREKLSDQKSRFDNKTTRDVFLFISIVVSLTIIWVGGGKWKYLRDYGFMLFSIKSIRRDWTLLTFHSFIGNFDFLVFFSCFSGDYLKIMFLDFLKMFGISETNRTVILSEFDINAA